MPLFHVFGLVLPLAGYPDPPPPVENYAFLREKAAECADSGDEGRPRCNEMSEPLLFRGIWRVEFENERFTPSAEVDCGRKDGDLPCIDLEIKEAQLDAMHLPPATRADCPAYKLEFVGRRTIHRGHFGWTGMPYRVVVDRLISAEQLPTVCDKNGEQVLMPPSRD